jgi:hypothetical protein
MRELNSSRHVLTSVTIIKQYISHLIVLAWAQQGRKLLSVCLRHMWIVSSSFFLWILLALSEYAEKDKTLICELLFLTISIFKKKRKRLLSFIWDKRPGEKILHHKLLESLLCIGCILFFHCCFLLYDVIIIRWIVEY